MLEVLGVVALGHSSAAALGVDAAARTGAAGTYTVKRGDTLSTIAARVLYAYLLAEWLERP